MKEVQSESCTFRIWIAGDYSQAVSACRKYTMKGLCVSLVKADFIYTGGAESGVCATLINYPRFPASYESLEAEANSLARFLIEELFQSSATVEGPRLTTFISRREDA